MLLNNIPLAEHYDLFQNIADISNQQTITLINIPNPEYLEYVRKNNPETLQVIDQPVPLTLILENLEKNGLVLSFFETYSIWVENDYHLIAVEKKENFQKGRIEF